jgi:CO/xanthine dehydrogenase Mo-binding subunit
MSRTFRSTEFPRRDFLKAGGALIVGFSLCGVSFGQEDANGVAFAGGPNQPDLGQLDTWLAIHDDNTATIFLGYVELGQGSTTALLQISAEELDLNMSQVKSARLDTNRSPNQGATAASAAIARGGPRVRAAAAEARRALLTVASKKFQTPTDRLVVSNGIVSVMDKPKQSVTYGQLVGDKPFHVPFTGTAPIKPVSAYKMVGTRVPRNDIPDKVSGKYVYMQHVRVPGMLHGRVVRPRGQSGYAAGAKALEVDAGSLQNIPNARVVRRRDFIGVVAPSEWDVVRAAEQLKVTWQQTPALPSNTDMHEQMRADKSIDVVLRESGNVETALSQAAHMASQTYRGPYQAHAPFGPACALAQVSPDSAVVMCSSQNAFDTRRKLAEALGMPPGKVRVQYYEGSGTFGRSCYDDAAQAAAILSQEVGKPVRVQFMRWDELGWDNYGPAHLAEVRAGVDGHGKIVAYEYRGWQHGWSTTETSQQLALGTPPGDSGDGAARQLNKLNLGSMYDIPNVRLVNHQLQGINGYLKGANLRSPLDISFSFASEQTIDELAFLGGIDPYLFRQMNTTDSRWLGVLNAVAQAAGWTPRRAATPLSDAKVVTGRGIAVGTHLSSYAATVAEIEVNKDTGRIVAKHMYGALDAGLAVNPAFVENQISGMLVQATSRILKEEVTFSRTNVTSLDWNGYPVLRFEEYPEVTPIVVQRMDQKSTGAGEEALCSAAAAIANAFFDATGMRLREYPMTPARVLAALGRGGSN